MKRAILLVSFGTSYADARENSLECIYRDLAAVDTSVPVYQAYTSGMIIDKLSGQGIKINTVDEAVCAIPDKKDTKLYVIPSHMIPGVEYQKLVRMAEKYRSEFKELKIADAVLQKEEDCSRIIPLLCDMIQFKQGYEYILMGHGTEDAANIRYRQMNEALARGGIVNVHIASVEAKPDLEDIMQVMAKRRFAKKVVLHPFMVVAGDHAWNDMAGEEDSYVTKLREAGYQVDAIVKGLGEYPQFRKIYTDKLRDFLSADWR